MAELSCEGIGSGTNKHSVSSSSSSSDDSSGSSSGSGTNSNDVSGALSSLDSSSDDSARPARPKVFAGEVALGVGGLIGLGTRDVVKRGFGASFLTTSL